MLTKEDLQAIAEMMHQQLQPMQKNISEIKENIGDIKEQLAEIDTATGMLAEWADDVAVITKVPFAKASGDTIVK